MNFLLPETLESGEIHENFGSGRQRQNQGPATVKQEFHILREKLRIPKFDKFIERRRLAEVLEKSLGQFCGTMLCGRAGSGKTALAADFAQKYERVAWYSVEASDTDWKAFANYFAAAVAGDVGSKKIRGIQEREPTAIVEFLCGIFSKAGGRSNKKPLLLVLDDVHRIFDAEWFGEFFHLLLFSLPKNVHLLMLCRSKPSNPLWRLRSKQMLNVIDEKLLAFNQSETVEFFQSIGLSATAAKRAHTESYGRISNLIQIAIRNFREGGRTAEDGRQLT